MGVSTKPGPAKDLGFKMAETIDGIVPTAITPSEQVGAGEVSDAGPTETVKVPLVQQFKMSDRVPEIGDHVFYWARMGQFNALTKLPAQLHSTLPILEGDPMSGWWKIGVHSLPGLWFSPGAVPYSDEPKENHWTWE